jgi:hypothetical protein
MLCWEVLIDEYAEQLYIKSLYYNNVVISFDAGMSDKVGGKVLL